MPINASPIKQMRKDKKRNMHNKQTKSALRTAVKKVHTGVTLDDKQNNLKEAVKLLDKAAQTKTIHWKNASRKKSRLTKRVNKLKKEAAAK